jgi:hypothetical protein
MTASVSVAALILAGLTACFIFRNRLADIGVDIVLPWIKAGTSSSRIDFFSAGIAIVGVLVVAITAVALVAYGTSAFRGSSIKGGVNTLIASGEQIAVASTFFKSERGFVPLTMEQLTESGTYLASQPTPPAFTDGNWILTSDGGAAVITLPNKKDSLDVLCAQVEADGGYDGHTDTFTNGKAAVDTLSDNKSLFGCVGRFFFYKLEKLSSQQ